MRYKDKQTIKASTLAELLIVIIVSGILFIALFDGIDMVKRYTNRLTKRLAGNTLLDCFQRMDYLFQKCDSIQGKEESYYFYWEGRLQVLVEKKDSLLCSIQMEQKDTLFKEVTQIRTVALTGHPALVDSLGISFRHQDKERCFWFGLAYRPERKTEESVQVLENNYKPQEDGME